jgi:hypothetical protein
VLSLQATASEHTHVHQWHHPAWPPLIAHLQAYSCSVQRSRAVSWPYGTYSCSHSLAAVQARAQP